MNALARLAVILSASVGLALAGCGKTQYTETPPPKDPAAEKKAPEAKAPAELKPQATCPVMGRPILKDVYLDHEGKRIYFCCPPCKDEFLKDPAKYLKKLEGWGQKPEDAPK
ncbi:MAG: YHS domain-containing protein [Planctomycetes bacterium]|jgi:YHS domain-containing protein|nr:YHS domain-containing protein [Planctomycetota bacterium]